MADDSRALGSWYKLYGGIGHVNACSVYVDENEVCNTASSTSGFCIRSVFIIISNIGIDSNGYLIQ